MNRSKLYTVAGFLLAPLVAAFCGSLLTPVTNSGPITPFGMLNNDLRALLGLTFVFYFYALPFSAVFAVPTFILFKKLDLVRWWSTILAGAVIGALCSFLFTLDRLLRTHDLQLEIGGYISWSVLGALGAMVFWLVWKQGQPKT